MTSALVRGFIPWCWMHSPASRRRRRHNRSSRWKRSKVGVVYPTLLAEAAGFGCSWKLSHIRSQLKTGHETEYRNSCERTVDAETQRGEQCRRHILKSAYLKILFS
ncbi:hypothetical protein BU26DRAFT_13869 [Trematosphaeria pertusa]|uniref:Uncharacterized protein n=1 Tax=Trematosphaeria pertusa TaxID=390896 RepID=A0A6A6IZM8_9PLEO|nr:uncharacterized protein BU26DRAFT_13869 [Trematosphaeria pertusa]KAF2256061.1 hypothetical protein BU26DRAFT_13869 [Trematosphaeria pertusa]